jgi:hypothetical protein
MLKVTLMIPVLTVVADAERPSISRTAAREANFFTGLFSKVF